MNRPPHTPRQNASAGSRARHDGPRQKTHARAAAPAPPPRAATPSTLIQPKINGAHARPAPPSSAERSAPSGVIQANLIGGTRALHNRLVTLHAASHREAASRSYAQARPGQSAAQQGRGSQTVQCKSSFGSDAFRVALQPKSGGQPLPADVRAKMETALGADFSDVRVHVGQEASRIGALAYTWGTNIHFAPGQYNPHTIQGQKILGHELWHVVQQKSGRVNNPFGGGVAVVQDHALEAEADRMGVKAAMAAVTHKPSGD